MSYEEIELGKHRITQEQISLRHFFRSVLFVLISLFAWCCFSGYDSRRKDAKLPAPSDFDLASDNIRLALAKYGDHSYRSDWKPYEQENEKILVKCLADIEKARCKVERLEDFEYIATRWKGIVYPGHTVHRICRDEKDVWVRVTIEKVGDN
jgi:hypothetical protein